MSLSDNTNHAKGNTTFILMLVFSLSIISLFFLLNKYLIQTKITEQKEAVSKTNKSKPVFPHEKAQLSKEEEEANEEKNMANIQNNPYLVKAVEKYTLEHPLVIPLYDSQFDSKNKKVQINSNISIAYPSYLSEYKISQQAQQEQAAYALQNFSPAMLDLIYDQYAAFPEAMLSGFGIAKNCNDSGNCHYKVLPQSSLIMATKNKINTGDTFEEVNGFPVSNIQSYNDLKQILFRNNPSTITVKHANGEQEIIKFNHST